MAWQWLEGLSAGSRLGAAIRLQRAGRLEDAKRALLALSDWFDERQLRTTPSLLGTRLMALVHLAEVAKQLGEANLFAMALQRWLLEWKRATTESPELRRVEVLAKWEGWVNANLPQTEPSPPADE